MTFPCLMRKQFYLHSMHGQACPLPFWDLFLCLPFRHKDVLHLSRSNLSFIYSEPLPTDKSGSLIKISTHLQPVSGWSCPLCIKPVPLFLNRRWGPLSMHQSPWSPERPLPHPVSLTSQRHHEKPPEVTCTSRRNPGFPASTGKDLERPSSSRLEARVPSHGSGADEDMEVSNVLSIQCNKRVRDKNWQSKGGNINFK